MMQRRSSVLIVSLLAAGALVNAGHWQWPSGARTGSFRPSDLHVSTIAAQAQEGYFPNTALNAAGFSGSLANVAGLVPGRQDLSLSLLSHATVLAVASPIDIVSAPVIPATARTFTADYRCKVLPMCTLTLAVPQGAHAGTLLRGYRLAGTSQYFIVDPTWVVK